MDGPAISAGPFFEVSTVLREAIGAVNQPKSTFDGPASLGSGLPRRLRART